MNPQPDQTGIVQAYLLIAIGLILVLMLGGAILLFVLYYQKRMVQEKFQRQVMEVDFHKKMIEAALESQENERRRVAGDLHDSIGAMLSTIRLSLLTFARQSNAGNESIIESKKMIDDTIDSVRRISRDLMPSTLEKFGLHQAVKEICERYAATSAMPIEYVEQGDPPPISKKQELLLFRIVQELMNNAMKHSQASLIKVSLVNSDKFLVIVEDNGVGFNLDDHKHDRANEKGLGLFNMENRARLAGAEIHFESEINKGSKTSLTLAYEKI